MVSLQAHNGDTYSAYPWHQTPQCLWHSIFVVISDDQSTKHRVTLFPLCSVQPHSSTHLNRYHHQRAVDRCKYKNKKWNHQVFKKKSYKNLRFSLPFFLERIWIFPIFALRKDILLYRGIHAGQWGSAVQFPRERCFSSLGRLFFRSMAVIYNFIFCTVGRSKDSYGCQLKEIVLIAITTSALTNNLVILNLFELS